MLLYCNAPTELELTEQKTTGQISASSQSSIAALKDVLAYGRLTSSSPLPPPHTLWRTHDHPYSGLFPYPYTYWGGLWVKPEGVGGGGEGSRARQSPVS